MADDHYLEIVIQPYFSEKLSDSDEILCAEADWTITYNIINYVTRNQNFTFEMMDERHNGNTLTITRQQVVRFA